MSVISKVAGAAVSWLRKAFTVWSMHSDEILDIARILAPSKRVMKRLAKFAERMEKVEATLGAHTQAWAQIAAGADAGEAITLGPAEVKYLAAFKDLFDRYIKKPFVSDEDDDANEE